MAVTIKQIASEAGVSTAAVSYALNDSTEVGIETKQKILEIANRLGYQPNRIAKSLRTKKTFTIGVIAEDVTVFNIPEIINGIGEYAESKGYNIILNNLRLYNRLGNNYSEISKYKKEITNILDNTLNSQVDGFIYAGVHYRDVTDILIGIKAPVVYTYCFTEDKDGNWVNYNDEETAYSVAKYLIKEKGHTKIGVITGMNESFPSRERLRGFQKAIIDHNLIVNPDYYKTGNWKSESGYRKAKELFKLQDPPTAIFAFNDDMAEGVYEAAAENNINIPNELSVIGFDNRSYCSYLSPKLNSVKLPLVDMGKASAKLLIDILENKKKKGNSVKLECKIIERQSIRTLK